jgi:hypothetical protein
MRELDYVILELEEWCSVGLTCDFCSSSENRGNREVVCQIRTRSKLNGELVANDFACESCKYRLEELPKCEKCGRLKTKSDIDFNSGKYVCECEKEEKELPNLPHERESMSAFYERQINSLQEQLNTAEWTINDEREAHEDFMEKSEEWSKRQKQELLDRIKQLEAENGTYKEEIRRLKVQLEQMSSQQVAQIEVKEPKKWSWLKIKK